ncbi:hypothetical protein [Fulvivirga sedimenti]|uniref:VanZ-like domain-containing protein n=1 Tax=Fulvivirga sedimenti TaxID=2879465 RepID=A0A9X1L1W6_9BACT|nr:hypothetical protein [Fulvivirga sedimenti]MCA6079114.1 hypothetical protein [Fulvivirga sedimenti]
MVRKKENNFFTDKQSFKTIDSKRIVYFLISVLFFFLTEIGRKVYRPFIYRNEIDDFGIADSIGNSGGIIVQIFFTMAILNSPEKKSIRVVLFLVLGYILYEIVQPYLPRGVFDWKDIYGSVIGGILAVIILLIVKKTIKNNVIYEFK